jgi:D-alanyl-lipoteichoic acid acyltransferase DltB (MBOAT superfamily)
MLFNSYPFLVIFLPIVVIGFAVLARYETRGLAYSWIVLSSAFFYGIWRPINLAIIVPSILANYALSKLLLKFSKKKKRQIALPLLIFGVVGNISFLGYFKYRDFVIESLGAVLPLDFSLAHIILPLGISFITFQKIAFLLDVYFGRVAEISLLKFLLFVMFFPQLIAGPIVHYREVIPQFERASLRPKATDLAVAVSLFSIGLFKKTIVADGVAAYVTPVFTAAANGTPQTFFWAWGATLAFSFQVYFDFSGYSDMALGLARIFGIRLPLNFNSPFKSSSIVEFWGRWHITLTRFLTGYVYTPMAMSVSRRRQKRQPVPAGRWTGLPAFISIVACPTIITMALAGLWHGAGCQFIVFGLIHGTCLTLNQGWRIVRPRFWPDEKSYERVMKPLGFALTFLCFAVAAVFFRASSIVTALALLKGMVGVHGIAIPFGVADRIGSIAPWLQSHGVMLEWTSGRTFMLTYLWIIGLLCVTLLLPNSIELLSAYEPALGFRPRGGDKRQSQQPSLRFQALLWRPDWRWAIGLAALSVAGLLQLNRVSDFLYWQF